MTTDVRYRLYIWLKVRDSSPEAVQFFEWILFSLDIFKCIHIVSANLGITDIDNLLSENLPPSHFLVSSMIAVRSVLRADWQEVTHTGHGAILDIRHKTLPLSS